jgi:hypothetical protein
MTETKSLNSYVLFSIGNIKPLLQAAFPACWKNYTTCDKTWVEAIDYLEICGIIVGESAMLRFQRWKLTTL